MSKLLNQSRWMLLLVAVAALAFGAAADVAWLGQAPESADSMMTPMLGAMGEDPLFAPEPEAKAVLACSISRPCAGGGSVSCSCPNFGTCVGTPNGGVQCTCDDGTVATATCPVIADVPKEPAGRF